MNLDPFAAGAEKEGEQILESLTAIVPLSVCEAERKRQITMLVGKLQNIFLFKLNCGLDLT